MNKFQSNIKAAIDDNTNKINNNTANINTNEKNINNLKPIIIYNDTKATTGNITLNENVANYSYIDIFFYDIKNTNNGYNSVRVYKPNSKKVNLTCISFSDATSLRIATRQILINEKNISNINFLVTYIAESNAFYSVSEIAITQIIGYK